MVNGQVIQKPSGFNKQRLDSFIRSVKTNKEEVQRKELDEALQQHTMLAAQNMLGKVMQLPPVEDLRATYLNTYLPQMSQAAYGMEIGAVMESAPAPFMYPSQMNLTPPNSDMFKKNMDRYEGKGTSALKGLFNTAANAILNPAIMEYNQNVYNAKQKAAQEAEDETPEARYGGSLPKAQKGNWQSQIFAGLPGMEGYTQTESGEYQDPDGNLLTQDQMLAKMQDAYNQYHTEVEDAFKNTPMPNMPGPPDLSYLSKYPNRQGLVLPGVSVSGEGVAPTLLKGTAIPQTYSNIAIDRPSLGSYMGLSPQQYLDPGSVTYSPNYKEMYKDATSKDQFDRFKTDITANPTAMGRFFDKIGVGKLVPTQNYKVKQTILPEGQSIFDEEYLDKARIAAIRDTYANAPGGGLFEGNDMDPYIWQNRSRRDRRDVLKGAGIDPSRKNLRRLGEDYFENLKQDRVREEAEASREGYENKLASEEAAIKSGAARGSIGNRPRNPYDLMGTGVQSVAPAPAVTGPTNVVVPPAVTPTQPNVVTPNSPTNPANKPRIYGMGRGDAASRKQYENNIMTPDDALASRFQRFEREEGSASGTGLDNYGWNNLPAGEKQPTNIREATDLFQRTYGAKAKSLGITNNDASTYVADYMFNSGRKPEDFLLYASGKVSLADVNGTASLDAQWQANKDQILQDINSGKISMETLAQKRDDILKTTRPKAKPTNPNDPNTATPSDAYINSWQKRAALPVQNLPIADYYPPTKKEGGTMLPMFQVDGEYPGYGVLKDIYDPNFGVGVFALPSADSNKTYSSIDWEPFQTGPLAKKKGPLFGDDQNKVTLGLPPLFPDADKMQTFFNTGDAPLTADAFSKQLGQYVPKYTGAEPQTEATAEYDAKFRGRISAPAYLNVANATGKYLADNVFGRDERRNAEEQFRKSRFLENNLALTSADTQFSPRLRGFDRTTDAYAGAPFAGANVQYGQPLIAQAQKGAQLMMTMQEGGVYTLTPEMIKQIIENGGEVEYMDNSINFENPFNQ